MDNMLEMKEKTKEKKWYKSAERKFFLYQPREE